MGAWARDITEGEDLGAVRRAHAPKWSVQWEHGQLFFLPLTAGLAAPAGTTRAELEVSSNLRLLARLTTDALVPTSSGSVRKSMVQPKRAELASWPDRVLATCRTQLLLAGCPCMASWEVRQTLRVLRSIW
jgi:hypothetical protein